MRILYHFYSLFALLLSRFGAGAFTRIGGTPSDWEEADAEEEPIMNAEEDTVFRSERYRLLVTYGILDTNCVLVARPLPNAK